MRRWIIMLLAVMLLTVDAAAVEVPSDVMKALPEGA